MNQVLLAAPLAPVMRRVLEDAAFIFCDDAPADAPATHGRFAEAKIGFQASRSGELRLRLPWNVAREAAANLLGVEPDDPEADEQALAAAGELLNMISGVALQTWFGGATKWSLGNPTVEEREGRLPSAAPAGEVVSFVVDDAFIELEAIEMGVARDQGSDRR